MKKRLVLVAAAWIALSTSAVIAQTVDEVVGKYVQAMGGADKLASLKTLRMSSTMEMAGTSLTQTTTVINQKAFRQEVGMQGINIIQVVEGDKGWTINPAMGQTDPVPLPDDMVKLMGDQLDVTGSLYKAKEKGNTLALEGKENVGTAEAYKLKLTKKNGTTEYHYLDAKTFLPVKVTSIGKFQGQDFKQEITSGNYQQVDGISFPFKMEVKNDAIPGGGPVVMTVSKIEVNPTVDDSIFKMPAKK